MNDLVNGQLSNPYQSPMLVVFMEETLIENIFSDIYSILGKD